MSEQIIAYGASVERSNDGGTTWVRIPEARGVAIPSVTTEYQEVTNLDSPGGFREFIKGLKDAGEISFPMGYTAAGYAMMLADEAEPNPIDYRVTFKQQPSQSTNGDVFEFSAFPSPQITEVSDLGAPIEMSVNLRMTGEPDWTPGA